MDTAPLQPKRHPLKMGLSVLLLATTSAMTVIRAMLTGSSRDVPFLLGTAAGPLLVVSLIVWLMGRRKVNRRPFDTRLLVVSAGVFLVTVFSLSNAVQSAGAQAPSPVARMQGLGRTAMADFLSRMAEINQGYAEASRALQTPDLDALYTAASYANRDLVSRIIGQLEQQGELDRRYNDSVDALASRVRSDVEAAAWPAGQKSDFLAGFDEGIKNSTSQRRQYFAADRELRKAAIDLYRFALAHFDHFSTSGSGKIEMDDLAVLGAFQQQAEVVDRLRDAMNGARADYLRYQERVKNEARGL